ncbi:hypothetical protein MAPG_04047 [Magnaporthiopsis poae ATCC 64411]|uniref:GIY-YIG domain-containing protein n=1 Tax=Magnaporthiopsis poae (strain ATCC 64411 / 73-15) TaxID=644358 RepID=A0A0C4DVN8_MAGP6|nr:hypothetical protein MAPG_04047 [Magnaporthiopsis poae ATCC 64411]
MATNTKPIPALYTVYVLRSTVRLASLYIGSTPNPPRRLKQHNGDARGGAAKTSQVTLRPWEMIGLVSGFPSMVGALKFEWALTNPHMSLHIPSDERISKAKGRKRNGMPKRPRASLASIISNVHLLLRVPSFARWPLRLHFFARDAYKEWNKCLASSSAAPRENLEVVTDFEPTPEAGATRKKTMKSGDAVASSAEGDVMIANPRGIHALPLDYTPLENYVAKGRSVFEFEREGNCVVCNEPQEAGKGLLAICTNEGCEGVGHVSCWSRHILGAQGDAEILPVQGSCPRCRGDVKWCDMMKELTLRTRAPKEVDKLLKSRRRKAKS